METELDPEEWTLVKSWLIDLRVSCAKKADKQKNQKIRQFWSDKSTAIRTFISSKSQ